MSATETIDLDAVRRSWSMLVDARGDAQTCLEKSPFDSHQRDYFSGRVTALDFAIGVLEDLLHAPVYGPDNPPRLRKPGESLSDYRSAMGWSNG